MNFSHIDHDRYPHFANPKALVTVLNPGDMLYLPPYWIHHVTALDVSISVNVFTESFEG